MVEIFFFHLQEEIVQSPLSPKRKLYLLFFLSCVHTHTSCLFFIKQSRAHSVSFHWDAVQIGHQEKPITG